MAAIFALIGFFGLAFNSLGQDPVKPLIKVGGFIYFLHSNYNGLSAHVEIERMVRKKNFLSTGPRMDFVALQNGDPTLLIGYELKIYPLNLKNRVNHQGAFIGTAPVIFPRISDDYYRRHGPGVSLLLGYQHCFSNDLNISVEGSWTYMKDLNKRASQFNTHHIYLYPFLSIKFGRPLGRRRASHTHDDRVLTPGLVSD